MNPHSLQKFTNCLQSVAQLLECPVCLDVVRPPAWQCCHGHVLCAPCRGRSTRCPICRVTFGPRGRCLIADKLFTLLAETFPCENKETGHKTCTATTPCSRSLSKPNPRTSPSTTKPLSTTAGATKITNTTTTHQTVRDAPDLRLHCPHSAGKSCARLGSAHELLTHLQRAHKTTVTQYYCNLGERIGVRFAERSISAVAIPKNGQLELFLVLRRAGQPPEAAGVGGAATTTTTTTTTPEDTCWVWYVGGEEVAAGYRVRLECGERCKWRGAARSLDGGRAPLADVWQREGCARIDASAGSVVVEIK